MDCVLVGQQIVMKDRTAQPQISPTLDRRLTLVALALGLLALLACAATDDPDRDATKPGSEPHPDLEFSADVPLPLRVAVVPADIPSYDRGEWRHWTDVDGDCQDARQKTLIAESNSAVVFESSENCRVESGQWIGPYTNTAINDPSKLDIDHMVPLANAHVSGGWAWSKEQKTLFANDISCEVPLVAATASANRAKGSRGPEDWRPANQDYWCQYAMDWITIKDRWDLSATKWEWEALQNMLDTCDTKVHMEITFSDMISP